MERQDYFNIKIGKKDYKIKNRTLENFDLRIHNDWKIIKSLPDKRLLLDWAMNIFKIKTNYFIQNSEVLPFITKEVEVEEKIKQLKNPGWYFTLLTEHLNKNWYVKYNFDFENEYPNFTILLDDSFNVYKKKINSARSILTTSLRRYLDKSYSISLTDRKIKGKAVLIQTEDSGFMDCYQLYFYVYFLLMPFCLTYAFQEKHSKKPLQTGIYDIVGELANLNGKSGFILKQAKLVDKLDDKYVSKTSFKYYSAYKWEFKITFLSLKRRIKKLINSKKEETKHVLVNLPLDILRLTIIIGGLYSFYQLMNILIQLIPNLF